MSIVENGLFSTSTDSDNSRLFSLDYQGVVPTEERNSTWFSLTFERDLRNVSYAR